MPGKSGDLWRGKPLEDMTKEELIEALRQTNNTLEQERKQKRADIKSLTRHRC